MGLFQPRKVVSPLRWPLRGLSYPMPPLETDNQLAHSSQSCFLHTISVISFFYNIDDGDLSFNWVVIGFSSGGRTSWLNLFFVEAGHSSFGLVLLKIIWYPPLFICGTTLNYFGLSVYNAYFHVTVDPTYSGALRKGPIPPFDTAGTASLKIACLLSSWQLILEKKRRSSNGMI